MSNLFQTCLSPILNEICVSECRRKFSEKVACQRHMYKDWAPRKRPVEEHQLEFTCIAQKIYSRANFICRFCGCGEKDGGPFFSYLRTAQHSLGRTCTLKVFELQREEWYPGNLLEPTPENIEEVCKESSVYDGLKRKYKSFYLKGESAVLQIKPKGNEPGEYSWSEKKTAGRKRLFPLHQRPDEDQRVAKEEDRTSTMASEDSFEKKKRTEKDVTSVPASSHRTRF